MEFLSELLEKIGYFLGFALGSIVKFFIDSWNAFLQFGKDAWNFVTVDIPNIIKALIDWFSKLPEKFSEWLKNTFTKIQIWGKETGEKAKETSRTFLKNITDFFKEMPGKIGKWLSDTTTKVKNWVANMSEKAREMGTKMYENIVKTLKELPRKVYQIGKDIIEGIWNGISSMLGWVSGKVKGFCKNFLGGFKKALGISSPSRLFKKQIGKNLALGIGEGFEDEMANVVKNMKAAIPTDFDLDLSPTVHSEFSRTSSPAQES